MFAYLFCKVFCKWKIFLFHHYPSARAHHGMGTDILSFVHDTCLCLCQYRILDWYLSSKKDQQEVGVFSHNTSYLMKTKPKEKYKMCRRRPLHPGCWRLLHLYKFSQDPKSDRVWQDRQAAEIHRNKLFRPIWLYFIYKTVDCRQ